MGRSLSSYHPPKLGDHRHFSSGDMILLICHVILTPPVPAWLISFESSPLDSKFGGHRSYGNGDISLRCPWEISIFVSILTWIPCREVNSPRRSSILRFWKSSIPIYTSEFPDRTDRKTRKRRRRRRNQAIANRYMFHANSTINTTNNKTFFFFK